MTVVRTNAAEFAAPEAVNAIYQRSLGIGLLFGVASLIFALVPSTREQFFHAYLIGFMLWLGVSLGSMAVLMIQHLTGGKWGMVIRRQLEAAMNVLPLMALLFIPIAAAGLPYLYNGNHESVGGWPGWLHYQGPDAHLTAMSHSYLTVGGYIGRGAIYFAIWLGLAFVLSRWSAEQDQPPVQNLSPRFRTIAAPGVILYAFTISFAVIDWVMSIDPHWYSTIFGFIFIVGECLSALCMMVVIERILVPYRPMAFLLKPKEVHDHGKLILTFVLLWAYFSFAQLLIIWAGNLPMEIRFFTRRLYSGWEVMGLGLVIFHFAIPFLFLLSRPFKQNPRSLVRLAAWLLFMRFIDLFWYIEPSFHKALRLDWGYLLDLIVPVAIGGLWLALFFRNLRSRPLLPVYDLHAQEFLEYVGAAHD
ncbi:MAG: hypothetical protein AUG89_03060 [Acidobacteria bacterium 13_1_20CM_4_56_7]|jgi:hypothetical protein|nr:MAG: hypothetical protein AUG89_03060 [Acidobacteria bacterium 13_1_20CM_4_56_7]